MTVYKSIKLIRLLAGNRNRMDITAGDLLVKCAQSDRLAIRGNIRNSICAHCVGGDGVGRDSAQIDHHNCAHNRIFALILHQTTSYREGVITLNNGFSVCVCVCASMCVCV